MRQNIHPEDASYLGLNLCLENTVWIQSTLNNKCNNFLFIGSNFLDTPLMKYRFLIFQENFLTKESRWNRKCSNNDDSYPLDYTHHFRKFKVDIILYILMTICFFDIANEPKKQLFTFTAWMLPLTALNFFEWLIPEIRSVF